MKISTVHGLILSQSMHVTDRRTDRHTDVWTDRITTPKTALAQRRAVKTWTGDGSHRQRHYEIGAGSVDWVTYM